MDEQERKRFEEWARPDSVQMRRNPETGEYMESGMSSAWAGWQAAAKAEREACKKICAEHADAAEDRGGTEDDGAIMAHMIWRIINERSNVELRGASGACAAERPSQTKG